MLRTLGGGMAHNSLIIDKLRYVPACRNFHEVLPRQRRGPRQPALQLAQLRVATVNGQGAASSCARVLSARVFSQRAKAYRQRYTWLPKFRGVPEAVAEEMQILDTNILVDFPDLLRRHRGHSKCEGVFFPLGVDSTNSISRHILRHVAAF